MTVICCFKKPASNYFDAKEYMISDQCMVEPNKKVSISLRRHEHADKNVNLALGLVGKKSHGIQDAEIVPVDQLFDVWVYSLNNMSVEEAEQNGKISGLGETTPEFMLCDCFVQEAIKTDDDSNMDVIVHYDMILGNSLNNNLGRINKKFEKDSCDIAN